MPSNRLFMSPCKLHTVQQFENSDYEDLIQFANWCLQNIHNNVFFPSLITLSDDYVFRKHEKLNSHNVKVSGTGNLHERREEAKDIEK